MCTHAMKPVKVNIKCSETHNNRLDKECPSAIKKTTSINLVKTNVEIK